MQAGTRTSPNNLNSISPNPLKFMDDIKDSINQFFFGSDMSVLFTIFGLFLVIGIGGTIGFEVILPNLRGQLLNNVGGFIVSVGFIWLLFKFKNDNMIILGRSFNLAFILYILLLGSIIFLFSG
jgi:hypothetical protein